MAFMVRKNTGKGSGVVGVREAARLAGRIHAEEISEGFLSSLGPDFLSSLYDTLAEAPGTYVIPAYLSEFGVDTHDMSVSPWSGGQLVGFICGTVSPPIAFRHSIPRLVVPALFVSSRLLKAGVIKNSLETMRYGLFRKRTSSERTGGSPELLSIAVLPNVRNRGVGAALVQALEDRFVQYFVAHGKCGDKNEISYFVSCGAELEKANRFYVSRGFRLRRTFLHHGKLTNEYIRTIPCSKL